jgi:hypothetical protein
MHYIPQKHWWIFASLHDFVSQKTELLDSISVWTPKIKTSWNKTIIPLNVQFSYENGSVFKFKFKNNKKFQKSFMLKPREENSVNASRWRMPSSGMWRRVDLVWADISEEHIANKEPAWAGGCRLSHQSKTPSYIRTGREGEWATWEINKEERGRVCGDGEQLAESGPELV